MSRERMPLPAGTFVSFDSGSTYLITGAPIGFGGGSILYPARKQCGASSDGIGYVLKECYPVSTGHLFHRDDRGEIVPDSGDEEDIQFLQRAKSLQLEEGAIGQKIYQKASRMLPIRDSSQSVSFTFPDHRTSEVIHNTFTVMDALTEKGRSLSEWVAECRRFTPAEAFRIVQQLLFALREVHQAGYLHLDIQDGNIFLRGTLRDKDELVTLIDFGCARELINGKTAPIRDKVIYTTQGYFAPEILLHNDGNLQLGPEADIFSVGCLALFLLTGQRANVRELMETRTGIYLKPNQFRRIKCPKHLAETLQRILAKALAKKPEDRYNCVDAMLTDVTELVDALQPYRSDLRATQFDAFVCYKHGPVDSAAALAVQRALENYRAPRGVCETKKPFKRIFVDEGELSSCADFGQQIQDALKNSGWLIVICSPDTPMSPWVQKEIDTFLEYHDRSRILALLTGGSPDQSFPPQLQGNEDGEGEVFAAHALGATSQEVIKKIRGDSLLKLVAPMIGTTYDALKQRHKIYQLQRVAMVTAGFLVAAMGFGAYALNRANVIAQQAVRIEEEYERALVNESLFLAEQAEQRLAANDPLTAMELALKALPSDTQDRPILTEAEYVLGKALDIYVTPCAAEDTVTTVGIIDTDYSNYSLSKDGKKVLTWGQSQTNYDGVVECWDAEKLTVLWTLYMDNYIFSQPIFSSSGSVYIVSGNILYSVSVETGEQNWAIDFVNYDEDAKLTATYNSIVAFSLSDDESKLLLFYGEQGDYFETPTEEAPCGLLAFTISAENGTVLRNISFQMDRRQRIGKDILLSPDSRYAAIHTSHEGNDFLLWSFDSIYLLDLTTGTCNLLINSETQIYNMTFVADRLAVVRSKGYTLSIGSSNSVYEYYGPYTCYLETYDIQNQCILWNQEITDYFEVGGVVQVLQTQYDDGMTAGTGLLCVVDDHAVLSDIDSGKIVRQYTLPSAALSVSLTPKGFEAILADGSYIITGFGTEMFQRNVFWSEEISDICQARNTYFVRKSKAFDRDYRIYKYQKNKWDDTYIQHYVMDKRYWRVLATSFGDNHSWVTLCEENRVCQIDVDSEKGWLYTVPEEYDFSGYRTPLGTSLEGSKFYWTGNWRLDNPSGWISAEDIYVLDFYSGEIQTLSQPPKPHEYVTVSDMVFYDDTLMMLAYWHDEGHQYWSVYSWNVLTGSIDELWRSVNMGETIEDEGMSYFNESSLYDSLYYDSEEKRLRFVLYDSYSGLLTRIVSIDTESKETIEIPVNVSREGGDNTYGSWIGACYQWNKSETQAVLCYDNCITIVDTEGQTVCNIPVTDKIVAAQFSPDGHYLLMVSQKGGLSKYRINDAANVASINLTDYDAELSSIGEKAWTWEFLDENTLLGIGGTAGYLVDISQDSLVVKAVIDQCVGYNSQSDRFVVAGGDSNAGINVAVGSFPRYTVEDLIHKANTLLNN